MEIAPAFTCGRATEHSGKKFIYIVEKRLRVGTTPVSRTRLSSPVWLVPKPTGLAVAHPQTTGPYCGSSPNHGALSGTYETTG